MTSRGIAPGGRAFRGVGARSAGGTTHRRDCRIWAACGIGHARARGAAAGRAGVRLVCLRVAASGGPALRARAAPAPGAQPRSGPGQRTCCVAGAGMGLLRRRLILRTGPAPCRQEAAHWPLSPRGGRRAAAIARGAAPRGLGRPGARPWRGRARRRPGGERRLVVRAHGCGGSLVLLVVLQRGTDQGVSHAAPPAPVGVLPAAPRAPAARRSLCCPVLAYKLLPSAISSSPWRGTLRRGS